MKEMMEKGVAQAIQRFAGDVALLNGKMEDIREAVGLALDGVGELRDTGRFGESLKAAKESVQQLNDQAGSDLAATFRQLEVEARAVAQQVFEGDPEVRLDTEILGRMTEYLPFDSLEQHRCLKLYDWAKAVHDGAGVVWSVKASDYLWGTGEALHSRVVLTRTKVFLQELRDTDEVEWFYSAVGLIGELGATVQNSIMPDIQSIMEALDSRELTEAAAAMVDDPNQETAILTMAEQMVAALKGVGTFCDVAKDAVLFYEDLCQCMIQSYESIDMAMSYYEAAGAVRF
jgi:hypothetical protein